MARNMRFGQLLREGITSVALRQSESKFLVEEGIAHELGYTVHTVQRWQRGYLPREPDHVSYLVRHCVHQGRMDHAWARSLLIQASYPDRVVLLHELFPEASTLVESENEDSSDDAGLSRWHVLVERGKRQSARYLEVVKGAGSGKYIPSLYCPRNTIEARISAFMQSAKTGMVITGEAGHGKTNLLSHLAEQWAADGHAVFLYNCGSLASLEVDQELAQDLLLPVGSSFVQVAQTISRSARDASRYFVVLFDAVNEFRFEGSSRAGDLLKNINSLIGRSSYPQIKMVLTCRTPTWDRLDILGETNLAWGLYYVPDNGKMAFSLNEFTEKELQWAYPLYCDRFALKSTFDSLSQTARQRCRDPLLLRLTSSAYSGHEIPLDAPSLNVFQEYYDQVERREDHRFLEQLAGEMWEKKTTALMLDDLIEHEAMGKHVTEDPDCAYERLKDLGFLMETMGDYFPIVQFTYERIFEYALCRHILRTMRSITAPYLAQLLQGTSEFPSVWGAAQFTLSVARNEGKLLLELADSVDYLTRQFALETLLVEYQDKPEAVVDWLIDMVRSESELAQRLALNAAYQIGPAAKSVFVTAASSPVEATRETVANYVLLLWRKDPDAGLDVLQSLIDHLQLRTLLTASNTLNSIVRIALLFYTNCWEKHLVWRTAQIEEELFVKLRVASPTFLSSIPGKIIEPAVRGALRMISFRLFRAITGSTTAQAEHASLKAALELPQEGRDRLERIIPFLDPSRKRIGDIAEDLGYLLQMRYGLAAVLSLGVLGVQLQNNFAPTAQLVLDLFEAANEAGRFALFVPFVNLAYPTTPEYYDLAWRLTTRMWHESPDAFFGDPWGTGTYLDATIATGIACYLHTGKLDVHSWLLEEWVETGDDRLLSKCISDMAVLGFFFPEQALEMLFSPDVDLTSDRVRGRVVQSLAAIRTLHSEQVDRSLLRAHAPTDLAREVWATSEPELIRVCIDAISLLTWVIHYATHSVQAREFISFFALEIAKARSPQDVTDPVAEYWWQRIREGNYGIFRAVVDKDYFAEFEDVD